MKPFTTCILACLLASFGAATGEPLQFLPDTRPQCVFNGNAQKISLALHNPDNENFNGQIHARIFQTSSATAVSLGDVPWKKLQVLAGETILESAALPFPAVDAETKFLVQWRDEKNRLIGMTSVLVYPTNLFRTLRSRLCETNFGVLDPNNQVEPLLKAQKISFMDLSEMNLTNFSGQLAIVGPFSSQAQVPAGLRERIKAIAERNIAVVWIQPQERPLLPSALGWERQKIEPSFYCVQKKQTAVVVVKPDLVSDLPENPQSQIALIYFCNLALNPQPAVLPWLSLEL